MLALFYITFHLYIWNHTPESKICQIQFSSKGTNTLSLSLLSSYLSTSHLHLCVVSFYISMSFSAYWSNGKYTVANTFNSHIFLFYYAHVWTSRDSCQKKCVYKFFLSPFSILLFLVLSSYEKLNHNYSQFPIQISFIKFVAISVVIATALFIQNVLIAVYL